MAIFFKTLLLSALLAGLTSLTAQETGTPAEDTPTQMSVRIPTNYKLQPKDVLRIEVFQEDDLTREVQVNAEGVITLPLIGNILVGDMTVVDAQQRIYDLYEKDYLVNPQINVLILQYAERRLTVTGQVNRPGAVLIPPEEDMTITEAIAGANGLTRLADEDKISLTRKEPTGKTRTITLDWGEIIKDSNKNIKVQDGDIIHVPERTW